LKKKKKGEEEWERADDQFINRQYVSRKGRGNLLRSKGKRNNYSREEREAQGVWSAQFSGKVKKKVSFSLLSSHCLQRDSLLGRATPSKAGKRGVQNRLSREQKSKTMG